MPLKEDSVSTGCAWGPPFGVLDCCETAGTWRSTLWTQKTDQSDRGTRMTSPMYIHSVPVFKQMLTALNAILAQADAQAAAKPIEPDAYLQARLYPDMFPLVKQVQIAADFARGVSARLAGVEVPSYEGKERSFADLDGLLTRTLAFLDGVPASGFEGSET